MRKIAATSTWISLFKRTTRLAIVLLVVGNLAVGIQALAQGAPASSEPVTPYVSKRPLTQFPAAAFFGLDHSPLLRTGGPGPLTPHSLHSPDPLWRISNLNGALPGVTPPEFQVANPNFPGVNNAGNPPDTNGAVGPNHYIQTFNAGRAYMIWNKQGTPQLVAPVSMQQIWIDAGAPATDDCRNRMRGDPYVIYDHLADRWVLTQFANKTTNAGDPLQIQCIAVSRGPDPVNDGFFAYTFDLGYSNDYPKLAMWPDGYYLVSQQGYLGNDVDVAVFDRATMLNGAPATFQHRTGSGLTIIMLPSELEGTPPPPGTPNFYVRPIDCDLFIACLGQPDRIEIREFHTDWGVPANSTFGNLTVLNVSDFSSDICAGNNLFNYCIDQPGVVDKLETLSVWPMVTANYRNFGDHESIVFNHSVDVDGNGLVGVRWYELRRNAGVWSLYQEGTYSPPDGQNTHRWMGSVAMDKAGNMALGFSVSNATDVFPGIRYTGRLATDPLGLMPAGEYVLAPGGFSSDNASNQIRWGDYSTMRVDPVDGCTFWYTTHYNPTGGAGTRIGAFRFPTCNPVNLSISKSDDPDPVIAGNILEYTINVSNGASTATQVVVTDTLPAGVIFLSSSIPCSGVGLTKTCSLGTLDPDEDVSFTIQVRIPANFLSSLGLSVTNITNRASVAAHELDSDETDNSTTESTMVIEQADVKITKVCKPDGPAQAGATGFCDIIVTNLGASDAQNVVMVDQLTSNAPFQVTGYVTTPPVTCAPAAPTAFVTSLTVTCNIGTLAAGASTTIKISVTTQDGADVNDVATVSSTTPDPDLSNNQATGQIHFEATANLSITKTSAPNPVQAGTNLTYTLTVSNAGPSSATNVVMTDTLPAQVSVVSITPSVGTCSGGIPGNPAQPVICNLGTLASGGLAATVTVVVKVNTSTPDGTILINNGAVTSATFDPNNANNVVTANSPVIARADLAITKIVDKPIYKSNKVVTYTIRVTNTGPSDALAVVVTDTLPDNPQLTYVSDTGGCTIIGNILTCAVGNLTFGTYRQFDIKIKVNGNQGTLTNTATATSSTVDPNPPNNTASVNISF